MQKDRYDEIIREEERRFQEQMKLAQQDVPQPDMSVPEKTDSTKEPNVAAALFFVFFFIADIIAMAVLAQIKPSLGVACFGALLLVIGSAALKEKLTWDNYPILMLPALGAVLTIVPIADVIHKNRTGETILTQDFIILLVSIGFFIAGLLIMLMPFVKRFFMLRKCTMSVIARCIYIDKTRTYSSTIRSGHGHSRSRTVYSPKWQYTINGVVYERQESTYSNVSVPEVGEDHEIFVNPSNPYEIYRNVSAHLGLAFFMGIMFMGGAFLALYAQFFAK